MFDDKIHLMFYVLIILWLKLTTSRYKDRTTAHHPDGKEQYRRPGYTYFEPPTGLCLCNKIGIRTSTPGHPRHSRHLTLDTTEPDHAPIAVLSTARLVGAILSIPHRWNQDDTRAGLLQEAWSFDVQRPSWGNPGV